MAGPTPPRPAVLCALVAAAALASPGLAISGISILPADRAPVELLEPADGAVLEGGREATIAWRAVRDLSADGIEEWEAFLSFDGGHHWPVRITPHLDVDQSSFRFVVPQVASDRVRIMLRFGDERREVGFVVPHALRSVAPDTPSPVVPLPVLAFEHGEPARGGDPGVTSWVEGDRRGRGLTVRSSAWTPPILMPAAPMHPTGPIAAMAPAPRHAAASARHLGPGATARPAVAEPVAASIARHPPSALLLHCRRNE